MSYADHWRQCNLVPPSWKCAYLSDGSFSLSLFCLLLCLLNIPLSLSSIDSKTKQNKTFLFHFPILGSEYLFLNKTNKIIVLELCIAHRAYLPQFSVSANANPLFWCPLSFPRLVSTWEDLHLERGSWSPWDSFNILSFVSLWIHLLFTALVHSYSLHTLVCTCTLRGNKDNTLNISSRNWNSDGKDWKQILLIQSEMIYTKGST